MAPMLKKATRTIRVTTGSRSTDGGISGSCAVASRSENRPPTTAVVAISARICQDAHG